MKASGETTEAEAADGISINAIEKESELLMKQPLDTEPTSSLGEVMFLSLYLESICIFVQHVILL